MTEPEPEVIVRATVRDCRLCGGTGKVRETTATTAAVARAEGGELLGASMLLYRRRRCPVCDYRWTTYEIDAATLELLLRRREPEGLGGAA